MGTETLALIGNRYQLERRIAVGGMGEVWQARDEVLGRRVAVKLLRPDLAEDEGFRTRFRTEARAAARLSHPGVVSVFDYGEQSGSCYLVMELIDGEPLSSVLARRGPLPPNEAMSIVAQAASVLAAAHRQGIVHRDVKPANLLLRPDGRVKVTDFGIARAAGAATVTEAGTIMGTVAYMSPEQVRGERVSSASDVYSLGVVAFQCLTGERPFAADESIAVALAHLRRPAPPLPSSVSVDVRRLVNGMLEKDPARRPPSAAAVAEAASRFGASEPVGAPGLSGAPGPAGNGARAAGLSAVGALTGRLAATQPHMHIAADTPPTGVRSPLPQSGPAVAHSGRHASGRAHSRARRAVVALSLCGALTLGGVLTAGGLTGGAQRPVVVPNLRGQDQAQAEAALAASDLRVGAAMSDTAGAPARTVLSQRPAAGIRVRPGTRVLLTVASGFVVLDKGSLDGLSYEAAAADLRRLDLDPVPANRSPSTEAVEKTGVVQSFSPSGRLRQHSRVRLWIIPNSVQGTQGASPTQAVVTSAPVTSNPAPSAPPPPPAHVPPAAGGTPVPAPGGTHEGPPHGGGPPPGGPPPGTGGPPPGSTGGPPPGSTGGPPPGSTGGPPPGGPPPGSTGGPPPGGPGGPPPHGPGHADGRTAAHASRTV